MKIPYKRSKKGISIAVRVQPRSSRLGLDTVQDGVLRVNLTAAPVDGAANEQLRELLSEALGVRKGAVKVLRGLTSRNKLVEIEGMADIDGP